MTKDERTKEALSEALIDLLKHQPLDAISIKELCAKAHVSRSAFYNNFHDKDAILRTVYQKAHHDIFNDKFKDVYYLLSDELIKDMINFFDKNSELLLVIHNWDLIDIIARFNTEMSMSYAYNYPQDITEGANDYFTLYITSALFNICLYWLYKGKDLPKDIFFKKLKAYRKLLGHKQDS